MNGPWHHEGRETYALTHILSASWRRGAWGDTWCFAEVLLSCRQHSTHTWTLTPDDLWRFIEQHTPQHTIHTHSKCDNRFMTYSYSAFSFRRVPQTMFKSGKRKMIHMFLMNVCEENCNILSNATSLRRDLSFSVNQKEIYCPKAEHRNLINDKLKTIPPHACGENERQTSPVVRCQKSITTFIKVCCGDQGLHQGVKEKTKIYNDSM